MQASNLIQKVTSPLLYFSGAYQRRWQQQAKKKPFTVVLAYHRVVEDQIFNTRRFDLECGVAASVFESQIRFMLKHFTPIQASQTLEFSTDKIHFAITLDDGFEDNFKVAAPILKKLGVPATFYAVTEYIGTDRLFWWDQLAGMMRTTQVSQLDLRKTGLGDDNLTESLPLKTDAERKLAYDLLCVKIRSGLHKKVPEHMSQLIEALEVQPQEYGREYALMDWKQLKELAQQGFEIGGHTATHCNVVDADQAMLEREITAPITSLESELGEAVLSFAYPYGHYDQNNNTTATILKKTHCRVAFTSEKSVVKPQSNPFELPRTDLHRHYHFACAYRLQKTLNQDF